MWPNSQETADLVIFPEEILNGKLHFLCSVRLTKQTEKAVTTFNLFHAACLFQLLLKKHQKTCFSDIFRGYRKRPLAWNGLNKISNKSSHRRCSVKNGVLKIFTNTTGKHLCWSFFLIKLQTWRPVTLLKRESDNAVCEIFQNTYFAEHLQTTAFEAREKIGWIKTFLVKTMINYTEKNILQEHLNNQFIFTSYLWGIKYPGNLTNFLPMFLFDPHENINKVLRGDQKLTLVKNGLISRSEISNFLRYLTS